MIGQGNYHRMKLKKEEIFGYIYKISNLINGKIYVGRTGDNVKSRFGAHKRRARFGETTFLYNAIRKYGEENFKVEEICVCFSAESTVEAEMELIKVYNLNDREIGYNMSEGGDGGEYGRVLSDETKNKIRKASLRVGKERAKLMVKTKIKRGTTGKGVKKHTEAYKKKMSKLMSDRKVSKETKLKMSKARKGLKCDFLKWTDERKEKFSKRQKKSPNGAKLNIEQVIEIKKLIREGHGVTAIGRMFGVSHGTISLIKSNKIWTDVKI